MEFISKIASCLNVNKRQNQFNDSLQTHYAKLYRLSFAWTRQAYLAEDLVQETMLKSIENQHQLQSLQEMGPWLCKIMHNAYMDKLRYQKKWSFAEMDEIDLHQSAKCCEETFMAEQAEMSIHAAIGCLSPQQRQVVTLVDMQGYSYQETAAILDVPVGTIMSRLSRAREKLKSLLQQEAMQPRAKTSKVVFLRSQK